jgi:prepilin-type N-terminal cleavage/methylation domain-containing protein
MTMSERPLRRSRGFTLIEVMMALTVLSIGVVGIIALERATIVTNVDGRQMTTASSIGRTWFDRLQADSTSWNHPSRYSTTSDLADTLWLKSYNTGWMLPSGTLGTVNYSYAFDINGNDVLPGSAEDIIYCTNVRLTSLLEDIGCLTGGCASTTPYLMRAEIRVYWKKNRSPITVCAGATPAGGADTLGADEETYHWFYMVGTVTKVTAQ